MFGELISNNVLIAPMLAWAIAQFLKTAVAMIKNKHLSFRYLISSGGIPSSHSALVTGLATAVALAEGVGSVAFGICVVLAFIVMYDAATVRRSVGQQAAALNRIMKEVSERRPVKEIGREFRVLIGHTPVEVLAGALLGIAVACLWINAFGV